MNDRYVCICVCVCVDAHIICIQNLPPWVGVVVQGKLTETLIIPLGFQDWVTWVGLYIGRRLQLNQRYTTTNCQENEGRCSNTAEICWQPERNNVDKEVPYVYILRQCCQHSLFTIFHFKSLIWNSKKFLCYHAHLS